MTFTVNDNGEETEFESQEETLEYIETNFPGRIHIRYEDTFFMFLSADEEKELIRDLHVYYYYFQQLQSLKDGGVLNSIGFPTFIKIIKDRIEGDEKEESEPETTQNVAKQKTKSIPKPPKTQDQRHDLTKIKGIGKATEEKFYDAGFDNYKKIANASLDDITDIEGISMDKALKIIKRAKELWEER